MGELATQWLQSEASHGAGGLEFPPKDGETSLRVHQFQVMLAMLLWMLATCAKVVLALLPRGSLGPLPMFTAFLKRISAASWEDPGSVSGIMRARNDVVSQSNTIERALTQVLVLVNDVPASSSKYLFLQDLAGRLIEENSVEGGKYDTINRAVLRRGFARTIHLLGQSLECRRPHSSFSTRFGALTFPEPFGIIWSLVGGALSPSPQPRDDAISAEKFARELLWITQKLLTCGGMQDAVQQWSSASPLAEHSLCASPNVQKSLVRLSALLCKSVMESTERTPHEVSANLLQSWMPLLCAATHGGGDGPLFASSAERGDAEQQVERLVASLPEAQQEQVLATWLHHFALAPAASHEWPNLVNCYHAWCYTTRKLE